jgi:hypothetical protein
LYTLATGGAFVPTPSFEKLNPAAVTALAVAGKVESPVKPVSEFENEFAARTIDAGPIDTKHAKATRNRKMLGIINDFSRQKRKRNCPQFRHITCADCSTASTNIANYCPTNCAGNRRCYVQQQMQPNLSFAARDAFSTPCHAEEHRITAISAVQRGRQQSDEALDSTSRPLNGRYFTPVERGLTQTRPYSRAILLAFLPRGFFISVLYKGSVKR